MLLISSLRPTPNKTHIHDQNTVEIYIFHPDIFTQSKGINCNRDVCIGTVIKCFSCETRNKGRECIPGLITSPGLDLISSWRPSRCVRANWKPQSASVRLSVCSTKRSSYFLLNLGCSFCCNTKTMSPVTVSGCKKHKMPSINKN